ncbi:MAG: hydrogenase nickel incorporation protein HypB, partial [Cyanobacteria bacterium J06648_11]
SLLVLNVISAPGSGKTATIERTVLEARRRQDSMRVAAIVGDLATDNDARRLQSAGIQSIQIATGTACHLDAVMVARAIAEIDLAGIDLLIIENVGNLVCPAAFDLGETLRVVLMSVTEGEDKPLKYPTTFKWADAVVVNKLDLEQAVEFDRDRALSNIHRIAPQARVFEFSARTGTGVAAWTTFLRSRVAAST